MNVLIFLVAKYPIYPEMTDESKPDVRVSFFELLLKTFFAICEPPKIAHPKPTRTSWCIIN